MKIYPVNKIVEINNVKWLIESKFRPGPNCSTWIVAVELKSNHRYVISGESAQKLLNA